MKLVNLAPVLILLPSCRPESEGKTETTRTPPAAEDRAAVLDFSPFRQRPMTVEEFVEVCQELSGFNFTYTDTTKEATSAASTRLTGLDRVPLPDFGGFLTTQLQGCRFTCERVGPENLRVYKIQPRAM